MARVIVVYESKYGNTKLVAEKIVEGIKAFKGIDGDIAEFKKVEPDKIPDYDVILIGSPNHIGGPTRTAKKFIDKLDKLPLKGKSFAVFDTYLGKDFEKAVKEMEKKISEKIPDSKLLTPRLSIRVAGMKGPVSEGELPKAKEFGSKIAAQLKA